MTMVMNWPEAFADIASFICVAAVMIAVIRSGRDE